MAGFVIMHRDILEWEWYQSPTVSRLYFHLILKVNYTDKKWLGILVKRGQLITSYNHLAIELKLSTQMIRTAIQKLQDGNYINVKSTNRYDKKLRAFASCNYTDKNNCAKQTLIDLGWMVVVCMIVITKCSILLSSREKVSEDDKRLNKTLFNG